MATSALFKFVLTLNLNWLLPPSYNIATVAVFLNFCLPNFKFELALSAILQYGYQRGSFYICAKLTLNVNWRFPAFYNTAISARALS